jgi:hypothetical protein
MLDGSDDGRDLASCGSLSLERHSVVVALIEFATATIGFWFCSFVATIMAVILQQMKLINHERQ